MIGIHSIASYIPERTIDNFEQGRRFGEDSHFIETKIGARRLPIKEDQDETSDLAVRAVECLLRKNSRRPEDIAALVVVTQNPDGSGLPHTAAIVHRKLALPTRVAALDVSLGCSGFVYGLSLLRGLMQEAGLRNGVLVTADPYSKIIDRGDRVTSLLFGDAATATWLSEDGDWKFGKPLLETDGNGSKHLEVDGGTLRLNGRQVFNFAAIRVPDQIAAWLDASGLTPSDIDAYVVHQGSAAIVEAIARRFPEVPDRFVNDMALTGNTVSSSIPILLEKELARRDHGRVLICGFGVGLSWATNMIQKERTDVG